MNLFKELAKRALISLVGTKTGFELSRKHYFAKLFPYVQAITYHDTPKKFSENLKIQAGWLRENYVNCNLSDLKQLLFKGSWPHEKPGLIISFDDGLRSNYDVALPILEEYGFTAWLMVPPGFVDTPPPKQMEFARANLIDFTHPEEETRLALSWNEVRDAEHRGHIITCHTMNHKRLSKFLTQQDLETEVREAKRLLEVKLGHPVDLFTWVGGEEWAYSSGAYKLMLEAGIKYIFCTNCFPIISRQSPFLLERYHVEPFYTKEQLRFTLSGCYDLIYVKKRRKIYNLLNS